MVPGKCSCAVCIWTATDGRTEHDKMARSGPPHMPFGPELNTLQFRR
jgi:hypothetical protein